MLTKTTLSAVLVLASTALAAPRGNVVARDDAIDTSVPGVVDPASVAKGGAIDLLNSWKAYSAALATATSGPLATDAPAPPLVTGAPARVQGDFQVLADAPAYWTITITNQFGHDIQTYHANNPGPAPTPNPGAGVIPNGGKAEFHVPLGWGGNVVENGGGRTFRGDESLIEASYIDQGAQWGGKKFDINVSYVTGFSLPITCSCDVGVIAGCNRYLWDLNKCPNDNGVGSCKNPNRDVANGPAATFFAPCAHAAYTYPNDSSANSGNGVCGGSSVTCCVGTSCPRNPRQP